MAESTLPTEGGASMASPQQISSLDATTTAAAPHTPLPVTASLGDHDDDENILDDVNSDFEDDLGGPIPGGPTQLKTAMTSLQYKDSNGDNRAKSAAAKACIVYFGNLDYALTSAEISAHAAKAGQVRAVNLKPGGFAFIEYADEASAKNALAILDGSVLADRFIKVSNAVVKPKTAAPTVTVSVNKPINTPHADDYSSILTQTVANSLLSKHASYTLPSSYTMPSTATATSVYVGGVPLDYGEVNLMQIFSLLGTVRSVKLVMDAATGFHKGYGFVEFSNEYEASTAITRFDGCDLGGGRILKVRPAQRVAAAVPPAAASAAMVARPAAETMSMYPVSMSADAYNQSLTAQSYAMQSAQYYQSPFQQHPQAQAQYSAMAYSSPYYGTPQAYYAGNNGMVSSAAVAQPANPGASPVGGPDNRIYIGNLSYDVTEAALQSMCSAFGVVQRVMLMRSRETGQSKGYAFVDFDNSMAAASAIQAMNNCDMLGRVMVVRHAMQGLGGIEGAGSNGRKRGLEGDPSAAARNPFMVTPMLAAAPMSNLYNPNPAASSPAAAAPDNRVYIGNVLYGVTEADLVQLFSQCGAILTCSLKRDPNTGQHRGFGFIDFVSGASATAAIERLNGFILSGRPLLVRRVVFGAGRAGSDLLKRQRV